MQILTIKFLLILSLFLLFSFSIKSQDELYWNHGIELLNRSKRTGCQAWLEKDKLIKLQSLWDEIGNDLKTDKNDFAGTYYYSGPDDFYFLRWSSNKGFVFINCNRARPDGGYPYIDGFAYGTVKTQLNAEVRLIPEIESIPKDVFKKLPRKWLVINNDIIPFEDFKEYGLYRAGLGRWNAGNYNYLGGNCCEYIVSPRFDNFRFDGNEKFKFREKNRNTSIPNQFKPFQRYPIRGKILSVGKKKFDNDWDKQTDFEETAIIIPVTINIGKNDGVLKNMLFLLPIDNQFLKVTKVNPKTSEGIIIRILPDSGKDFDIFNKPFPPVKIGDKITTSRFE